MRRINCYLITVLAIAALIAACGTMNVGNTPWTLDIQNWSSTQRANFFMNTWLAEKRSYDSLNAMADKPASLVESLKAKYKILENSRQPIWSYATIVNSGGTPDADKQQQIIDWIRQLQTQYIYK